LGALTVISLLAYRGREDAYSSVNFLFVSGVTWEFNFALAADCVREEAVVPLSTPTALPSLMPAQGLLLQSGIYTFSMRAISSD
jgi:hypothetical protein